MAAEWTGQVPDPSLGPPQPGGQTLKHYADALMETVSMVKATQVRLEVHGRVLVLRDTRRDGRVYAIGMIDE